MRAAVIDAITGIVLTIIVADPVRHPAPVGTILVTIPDDSPIQAQWEYQSGQFIAPRRYAVIRNNEVVQIRLRSRSNTSVPTSPGSRVIPLPDDSEVVPGYTWTSATGFQPPVRSE